VLLVYQKKTGTNTLREVIAALPIVYQDKSECDTIINFYWLINSWDSEDLQSNTEGNQLKNTKGSLYYKNFEEFRWVLDLDYKDFDC